MGGRLTGAIMALCQVSELRDVSTSGHQKKCRLWRRPSPPDLGFPPSQYWRQVRRAHPRYRQTLPSGRDSSKPAPLTKTEYELVKTPGVRPGHIVASGFPWPIAEIILQHHERLDGSGYPRGLRNDEICIEARILAAADSFDAMTSDRPYRDRMSPGRALSEIKLLSGRAYDPVVVMALEAYLADREGAEGEEKGKRAGL